MKKRLKIILIIMGIILLFGFTTGIVDYGRIKDNKSPMFTIKMANGKTGKVTYLGMGYKVIGYFGVSINEPFEHNIGLKFGSWFMKYEISNESEKGEDKYEFSIGNEKLVINNLDDFYNTMLTKDKDIRSLEKDYSILDAQKDNCFVIGNNSVYNNSLYVEFIKKYNNDESAFIRIAETTVEGDLILFDLLYYKNEKQFYLVTDNTRDKFSANEDRKIELKQFNSITEYNYDDNLYWVLYNNEINDEIFESNDVFIIYKLSKL